LQSLQIPFLFMWNLLNTYKLACVSQFFDFVITF
jgi:hypothetical protein